MKTVGVGCAAGQGVEPLQLQAKEKSNFMV